MYFISLPNFELNIHLAIRPVLKDIPFAISNGTIILAANAHARQSGIDAGMRIADARKKSVLLSVEKPKPMLYENFSKEFYKVLTLFTSTIEPVDYHSAFFDLQPSSNGLRDEIIRSLIQRIEKELEVDVAVGEGISKTVAQIANQVIAPKGMLSIPKEQSLSFLQSIPVSLLPGIGRRSAVLLWGLGIKTLRDFVTQSDSSIVHMFGKSGLLFKERALGNDPRTIEPPQLKKSISKSITLGHPSNRWHYIVSMLHFCLTKIERELLASCQWSNSFQITITFNNQFQRHLSFQVQKNKSIRTKQQAESTLKTMIAEQPHALIRTIQIRATHLEPEHHSAFFFKSIQAKSPKQNPLYSGFSNLFSHLRAVATA